MKQFLLILLFIATGIAGYPKSKFIPVNHEYIRYVGRFDFSNPEQVSYDWSGIYIQFNVRSSECSVKMSDTGHNYYNVLIDNQPSKTFDVRSDTTLLLAKGLGEGVHKVQIYKRTEGFGGIGAFKGIELPENGEILPWKDIPKRKIEFIGNSITCGYGTEGLSKDEHFKPETENNYQSYAPIMARAFHADYHIVAHSGEGVVRNYGYKEKASPRGTMPRRFNRVFDEKEQPLWDFKQWKPDMVVINLGTNDFSTQPFPDKEVFIEGYQNLVSEALKRYGEIPVFCVVGPMIDEPCYSYVKEMVEDFRSVHQKKNVYFIGIPGYLTVPDQDLGSDYHPNYKGQLKMASHVLPVIASVTGWDYQPDELRLLK